MLYTTDASLCRPWIEARLVTMLGPHATFLARLREDGSIWGCVAYDRFSSHNCEMHMAGDPGWVSPAMARHAFRYPFGQLGLARVTGLVASDDDLTLGLDKRMGFREEGRMRQALGPDLDVIILGMLRDECRIRWQK
jgi:RimJ/RimL family protein N-acetyltransferase